MDARAMSEFSVPGVVLMENAGRAAFEETGRLAGGLGGKRVAVLCGGGNNGGDGFVVARYCRLAGAVATIFCTASADAMKADPRAHFDVARKLGIPCEPVTAGGPEPIDLSSFDILVDALLGTGVEAAPRAPIDGLIRAMNASGRPIVAVDLPSGVNADTGGVPGEAVRATSTVTFAYPKLGLLTFPGAAYTGRLIVDSIGFDWEALGVETGCRIVAKEELRVRLPKRADDSNKGDYGHVAVVAGSRGMVGAPALTARAAQRAGAGLVTVLTAESAQPLVASKLDEQMTRSLPEADGAISEAAFEAVAEFASRATVLCVGPGMTTSPETVRLVQRIVAELDTPIVLDADGLNALSLDMQAAQRRRERGAHPLVLTPHPGEAARLLGRSIPDIQADRAGAARDLAKSANAVVILKGRHTLVAEPGGSIQINTTGNPGMASGGMGDALTGILGSFLAQALASARHSPDHAEDERTIFDIAALSVLIHGAAGDLAAAESGQVGMTAGDLIGRLPAAIRLMEEQDDLS
jgi:NAD(P)H-hydrate epimerase